MSGTLFVGTDVSQAANRSRFYDEAGTEIGRRFESANDLPGSQLLADEAARRAKSIGADEIKWGLEATNFFWWHLACFLTTSPELIKAKLKLYTFNARVVAKFKQSYPDIGKGDWVDAMVIADRLRFGRLPAECYLDERYMPLQRLTRYRKHLVDTLVREKQVALGYVYLKLSAYGLEQPLHSPFSTTSQMILESYLTPDEIVSTAVEELADVIRTHSRARIAEPEEVAKVVQQAARRSYRLQSNLIEPINLVLTSSLQTIRSLSAQLKPLDKAIATELKAAPVQSLASIPGMGPVLTSGCVAEIGDVRRFQNEEALAKFAGLTWRRHQSGEFESEDRPLTKTGNSYLRYYLIESANSVRKFCPEFGSYYNRKHGEATRHHHRRALVLTSRKLVRLVDSLLRTGQIYRPPGSRNS